MKSKLYKIEDVVRDILTNDAHAREDDYYLMYKVIEKTARENLYKPYGAVLLDSKNRGYSFKSVERARRKVQEKYPDLKPSEKVQEQRLEYENMYVEYAIEGNHIPQIDYNIGE